MPNHITTVCTVTGEVARVQAFQKAHITTDKKNRTQFDFETIIPMPECVKATIIDDENWGGGFGDADVELYAKALMGNKSCFLLDNERIPGIGIPANVKRWGELLEWYDSKKSPAVGKLARAALESAAETGHRGWYEWSCANWGTKWDAYRYDEREVSPGRFVFKFETAWAPPEPIFDKLAELWPDLTFETESIDEGGGDYVGTFHGERRELKKVTDSDERYKRVYGHARETYDD